MITPGEFVAILSWGWFLVAFGLGVLGSVLSYRTKSLLSLIPGFGAIFCLLPFVYLAVAEVLPSMQGFEAVVVGTLPILYFVTVSVFLVANHHKLSN